MNRWVRKIRLTKRQYGWPEDATFLVPDGVRGISRPVSAGAGKSSMRPGGPFEAYRRHYPALAENGYLLRRELPDGWDRDLPTFPADATGIASRDASSQVLNVLAEASRGCWEAPQISGLLQDAPDVRRGRRFQRRAYGRNLHFGIREHAMGAMLNGLSLSAAAVRLGVLDLQRLRAHSHSPECPHGNPRDPHLYA